MSYIKPVAEIKRFCMIESISSCDYWSCLVNSNQHEYTGGLTKYSNLGDLLSGLQLGNYGYVVCEYNNTTYYIWTSNYESTENTDGDSLTLLQSILGITRSDTGELSGDWLTYVQSGMVHFTTGVTESTVHSS